ncbi:BON domain-containing protein [Streptomyces sp. YGL11-2]|uniref:BON domain-containing protein n=1 Tax=Streptomyces sp. YGL11-2 TaxID=3414028 RepID=UPI003CF7C91B
MYAPPRQALHTPDRTTRRVGGTRRRAPGGGRTLGLDPASVTVRVTDGRVTLSGTVPHSSLVPIAIRLCESVDGVVDVTNHLGFDVDDAGGGTPRP